MGAIDYSNLSTFNNSRFGMGTGPTNSIPGGKSFAPGAGAPGGFAGSTAPKKPVDPHDYSQIQYQSGNALFDNTPTPGYQQGYTPGSLQSDMANQFKMQDQSGYGAFKDQALNQGPSAWLNMATHKNNLDTLNQKENALRSGNAATHGALDQLGMTGGMSSGARERAIEGGQKNNTGVSQEISRQGSLNNLNLGMQDQTNHMGMMAQLPGMEANRNAQYMTAVGADTTNQHQDIAARTAENQNLNQFNQNLYQQRMQAAAAEAQARATSAAGRASDSSGLLGGRIIPGIL